MKFSFELTRLSRWMLACAAMTLGSFSAEASTDISLNSIILDEHGRRIVPTKPRKMLKKALKQRIGQSGFAEDASLLSEGDQDANQHKLLSELALSRTRVNDTLTPETTALFGDQVDLNTGTISFLNTDVSIPGNSELSVAITRAYRSVIASYGQSVPFADWQLAIPAISTDMVYGLQYSGPWGDNKACSGKLQPEAKEEAGYFVAANHYWSGDRLHIPGVIDEPLLEPTSTQSGTRTIKNWKVSCLVAPTGIEGFRVTSPQGITYEFTQRKLIKSVVPLQRPGEEGTYYELDRYYAFMQVTRITDRFQNWVKYRYNNEGNLDQISANDGRVIDIQYGVGLVEAYKNYVSSITANGQIWKYEYRTKGGGNQLYKVTQPDRRYYWEYDLQTAGGSTGLVVKETYTTNEGVGSDVLEVQCIPQHAGLSEEQTIKHPNGATLKYRLQANLFGRSQVKRIKEQGANYIDRCSASMALASKTLDGPGLPSMSWSYRYSQNPGAYAGLPAESNNQPQPLALPAGISGAPGGLPLLDLRSTEVVAPDDSKTLHVFDRRFNSVSEGQEVATYQWDVNSSLLRATSRTFSAGTPAIPGIASRVGYTDAKRTPQKFGTAYTFDNVLTSEQTALKVTEVLTSYVQGSAADTYTTTFSDYNQYGTAQQITESNNFNSESRTTILSYEHDTRNWLLNLETSRIVQQGSDGASLSSATYYSPDHAAKSSVHTQSQFGQLRQTHEYHSTGLLKKTTYADTNRWISFDNYKRGKPRLISLPNRYSSGSFSIDLVINDNGTIASARDLNRNKTSYSYDNMNRLTLIDPEESSLLNTSIVYENDTTGVGALQQQISRGRYRKTITLDGLLRPILTKEWDNSNEALTVRYIRQEFNSYGNVTFSSVPSAESGASFGSHTSYDGLQRMVRQTNTANGDLSYSYGANNTVSVGNSKGYSTTTRYLAFGSPETKFAQLIEQPEGVSTSISYNAANLPVSITQGGVTEIRRYDGAMQLCLQKRPDTGIKVLEYTVTGEVARYAEGVSGNGNYCSDYSSTSISWVSQTYDNLGAPWRTSYQDGTADIVATLDRQGNLKTLVSGNNSWSYSYNSLHAPTSQSLTIDGKTFSTGLTYNNLGNLESQSYGGATLQYAPNALGQPTQVADSQTYVRNVVYHPNGLPSSYTYGNGLTFVQTLNNQFKPLERQVKSGSALLSGQRYGYDSNDNLDAITDLVQSNRGITMSFDGLDRLNTASGSWGNGNFDYDTLGNITVKQLGSQNLSYVYHPTTKRLSTVTGGYNFNYDDRGNVINNGKRAFQFNRANQLISSGTIGYQYDGHGRRVKKTGSSTGYSMYDLSGSLLLTDGPNGQTRYIHLGKELIAKVGSSAALEDKPGYTGHVEDKDLSLTYMQQRYYDPVIGRFYSNDPVGFTASNPMMFNRYAYANNNPYKYTDPDGRAPDVIVDAAFTIYDAGQTLGAAAAYAEGVVTGNEALTAVAGEGLASSATNLAMSAGSMVVPGVSAPMLRGGQAVATNAAPVKASKMQQKVEKGQAPKSIARFDKADANQPNSKDHVHKSDGTSMNNDGTVHDKKNGSPEFTNKEKEFLKQNGWPTEVKKE